MSVLVKGMEIPNNCGTCPLRLAWCRERLYMVTRPPRCPLIELPDHGDLVDRDEFIKVHREYFCTDCVKRKGVKNGRMRLLYEIGDVPCRACGIEDMFEYIDDAPVVIPAERSEDERLNQQECGAGNSASYEML